ncbi:MAG: hypothetical protein WKG01_05025 [Kofleriaceae bacterium]
MSATRILVTLVVCGCSTDSTVDMGQLFVADWGANAIVRFDGATGAPIDVFAAGSEQRVDRPASVRPGPDGELYLAGFGRGDVVRYDLETGAMMNVFYRDTTLLEEPVELAFAGDELVVLGNDTANLVVLARDGRVARTFGYPMMRGGHDFALADGLVYVATDSHPELGHAVQVWDVARGVLVRSFGGRDELASATGIAVAGGIAYVCDYQLDRVVRYDDVTGASLGTLDARLESPISLELGPDGALYVLDAAGIHRLDPETGADRGLLVDVTGLEYPRSFTFI